MFNGNANGDGQMVLDGVLAYIEIMEPRRLADEQRFFLENNWSRIAGVLSTNAAKKSPPLPAVWAYA